MAKMKVAQAPKAGGPLEIIERPIPEPGPREVRIRVDACGVCHSDSLVVEGYFPGLQFPRIPGHEIAGSVDAVGSETKKWQLGQRVGVGWHGGHCFRCDPCRRGDFMLCDNEKICGISYDGGYGEYMIAPEEVVVAIPGELDATEAGPLLCAGITTFNSLRNSGVRPGDTVAILGIGGLGHLGVQFAAKSGFRTIAIARGKDKEELAKQLGAHHYIDSKSSDPAEELQKLGGAHLVLATVTSNEAMSAVLPGLRGGGKLIVLGVGMEPFPLNTLLLIGNRRTIVGWPCGTAIDSEDTLNFSVLAGVRSMNEVYPLEQAQAAYDRMMSGKAKFRVVLKMR